VRYGLVRGRVEADLLQGAEQYLTSSEASRASQPAAGRSGRLGPAAVV
jgi:hypothetical protein